MGLAGMINWAMEDDNTEGGQNFVAITWSVAGPAFTFFVYVWARLTLSRISKLETASHLDEDVTIKKGRCGEAIQIELYLCRLLQAFSFVTAYEIARILFAPRFYRGLYGGWAFDHGCCGGGGKSRQWKPEDDVVHFCLMLFLYALQCYLLRKAVVALSVCLAIPPYVDKENLNICKAVAFYQRDTLKQRIKAGAAALGVSPDDIRKSGMICESELRASGMDSFNNHECHCNDDNDTAVHTNDAVADGDGVAVELKSQDDPLGAFDEEGGKGAI